MGGLIFKLDLKWVFYSKKDLPPPCNRPAWVCWLFSDAKPGNPATLLNSNVRSSRQCGIHCPIHCNLDRRRSKHPRQRGASPRKNFENQLNKLAWAHSAKVLLDNKASENWPGKHFDINLQFNQVQQKSSLSEVKSNTPPYHKDLKSDLFLLDKIILMHKSCFFQKVESMPL